MFWINDVLDVVLDKRYEGRGLLFFTIFLSHSKNNFFDDFLQFHGRNIFNFPFLVTGVKILFKNFLCRT